MPLPSFEGTPEALRGPQKAALTRGDTQLPSPTLRSLPLVGDEAMSQAVSRGTREFDGDCDQLERAGDFFLWVPVTPQQTPRILSSLS